MRLYPSCCASDAKAPSRKRPTGLLFDVVQSDVEDACRDASAAGVQVLPPLLHLLHPHVRLEVPV
eukprot:656282-Rhodomonas_salina.1